MSFSRVVSVIALALAIVAAGCADPTSPPPSFTGTRTGTTASEGVAFSISITARETNGRISGSGVFTVGSAGGLAFTVTGNHAHPQVNLAIRSSGVQEANSSGSFTSDNGVDGTPNGSGFANLPLALQRQRN